MKSPLLTLIVFLSTAREARCSMSQSRLQVGENSDWMRRSALNMLVTVRPARVIECAGQSRPAEKRTGRGIANDFRPDRTGA